MLVEQCSFVFPKKLNRKSFGRLRKDYRRETGEDLCRVVDKAYRESLMSVAGLKGKRPKDLRTWIFKLVDYENLRFYCKRSPSQPKKRR